MYELRIEIIFIHVRVLYSISQRVNTNKILSIVIYRFLNRRIFPLVHTLSNLYRKALINNGLKLFHTVNNLYKFIILTRTLVSLPVWTLGQFKPNPMKVRR